MNEQNKIVIYQTEDGQTQIDVRMENETVWLSTNQMALLFNREESNIRRHIINVFKEGELPKDNNVHFLHVNGVKKLVPFYTPLAFTLNHIFLQDRRGKMEDIRSEIDESTQMPVAAEER